MTNPCPPRIRIRVGGVYAKEDKLLFVRHQKGDQSYWLLPGGGLEPGESMAEALERESLEECGILTKTERLLFVSEAISLEQGRHYVNLTFLGRILQGEPSLHEQGARIAEVAWLTRAEVSRVTLYPDFWNKLSRAWDADFACPTEYLGNIWRDG